MDRRGLFLALALALAPAAPARAELDAVEQEMAARIREDSPALREKLARWVAIQSGSRNLQGIERMLGEVQGDLEALGFAVERIGGGRVQRGDGRSVVAGPLLRARRAGPKGSVRLLLIGHVDTVFEPESGFSELGPESDGCAVGPGAADMKGGLIVMLRALAALAASADLERASWTAIVNSDEELGSPGSRAWIEAEARAADLGFVFESAQHDGAMVRSRRGVGEFELRVEGVAAHAGSAHHEGHSAILELAHKVVEIEALTDYARGVTVNTGTIRGGSKRNVVPAHAVARIDVRFDDSRTGEELRAKIQALAAKTHVPGTRTELRGALHRPPRPATPESDALLARHAEVARDLGLALPAPIHAGGGTDGSLSAAAGLPTLDSMGVRGGRVHTHREFVVLESLGERAALAAILWRRLIHAPRGSRLDSPPARR
jgi:glutamate carboxypeptidase